MTKRHPDDPHPTWYRLSPETWALIRDEYAAGATARELARKYRTSATSIYRYASLEGWTKQAVSEALARTVLTGEERQAQPQPARASPPASDDPATLEKQALTQMSEALAQGRAGEARALAALADQMRKRAEVERAGAASQEEAARLMEEERVAAIMELFGKAAYLAHALVHSPTSAPAVMLRLVKRWREINLGEGEKDAEARAAKVAESYRHFLDGSWVETTPEDVRAYLAQRWDDERALLGALPD